MHEIVKTRSEQDIIKNWTFNPGQPLVSICCITYNHVKYIEEALVGFLSQETIYPFEIIIHDDASTDGTDEIILRYQRYYPSIIKVILQNDNQFSKNFHLPFRNVISEASGEYIALCEGDDFWISSNKIQTQVDLMMKYPDVDISFHPAYMVNGTKLERNKILSNYGLKIKLFSPENVVLADGQFMPTQSIIVRDTVINQLPDWFYSSAPVGDYYIQIIASLRGGALFVPYVYSAYRTNINGSWSSNSNNKTKRLEILNSHFEALTRYNNSTAFVLDEEIKKIFSKYFFVILIKNRVNQVTKNELFEKYKTLMISNKLFDLFFNFAYLKLYHLFLKKSNY